MAIKITFAGAAGTVTGSKHLVEVDGRKILLDCGLHQGNPQVDDEFNRRFVFEPRDITDIILSHGHLDHCGSVPTLVKRGFDGTIWATPATHEVAYWIMKDSAHIQQQDFEYGSTKCSLSKEECSEPIYEPEDVEESMKFFRDVPYRHWQNITENVRFKFYDAGHILGSACILLEMTDEGRTVTLGFSGDLGRKNMPILQDPDPIQEHVDYWITESTYGDRLHGDIRFVEDKMIDVINPVIADGGKIIAPSFSLGRTQELVYILHRLVDQGKIKRFPIFVDSPLAASITGVFMKYLNYVDRETREEFIKHHENPFGFRNLTYTRDKAASQMLNNASGPLMVIAAAGMANAGRILHHLLHGLSDSKNLVFITSYMAKNTLGRLIKEGARKVRIFGQEVEVNAKVVVFDEFSAHADYNELLDYIDTLHSNGGLKKVFLVHGEDEVLESLKNKIYSQHPNLNIHIPTYGEAVYL